MNPIHIIDKYYPEDNELKHILLTHSHSVADKALMIADGKMAIGTVGETGSQSLVGAEGLIYLKK